MTVMQQHKRLFQPLVFSLGAVADKAIRVPSKLSPRIPVNALTW